MRIGVARVGLRPQFIDLARCFQVPGEEKFIVRGDVKLFAIAYPFAKLVGLANILFGTGGFAQVHVAHSQTPVCHGKVGVQAGGPLEQRNGGSVILSLYRLAAQAVGLQRLQRWCGHVLRWRIILLHGGQRLAQLLAHFRCRLAQRFQHLLLAAGRGLFVR